MHDRRATYGSSPIAMRPSIPRIPHTQPHALQGLEDDLLSLRAPDSLRAASEIVEAEVDSEVASQPDLPVDDLDRCPIACPWQWTRIAVLTTREQASFDAVPTAGEGFR